jgi:succinylglutamate desuccinylase
LTDADFLELTLAGHPPAERWGETPWLTWRWLEEGVIELLPRRPAAMSLVLSAGIHGNETTPVELINLLLAELMTGRMLLAPRLLVILGNPQALRAGKRYIDYDLNRLFGGGGASDKARDEANVAGRDPAEKNDHGLLRHADAQPGHADADPALPMGAPLPQSNETLRCRLLQRHLGRFFLPEDRCRWHLDMHTAIRGSRHVRFGLLPYQPGGHDPALLHWLNAAQLDALVRHRAAGTTFTHYSSEQFSAASVTLELGKALPFGANDLAQFNGVRAALWALISGEALPERLGPPVKRYRVCRQITRTQSDFTLLIPADTLNFTVFDRGELLARETGNEYRVREEKEWVLFPNPDVAIGLRAGLMLVEDEDNQC